MSDNFREVAKGRAIRIGRLGRITIAGGRSTALEHPRNKKH
jgi:hypothetical protein